MADRRQVIIALRLAAAQAEKLANDVERNSLWGKEEFNTALINAVNALQDASRMYNYDH